MLVLAGLQPTQHGALQREGKIQPHQWCGEGGVFLIWKQQNIKFFCTFSADLARTDTKTPINDIDKLLSTTMKVPAGVQVNFDITASHSSQSKKHALCFQGIGGIEMVEK